MDLDIITAAERTATREAGYGRLWTLWAILKGVLQTRNALQQTPKSGAEDAAGSDAYDTATNTTRVWTHPADGTVYSHVMYSLDAGHKADLSFDTAVTTHLVGIPGNTFGTLDGVSVTGDIHGRNTSAGNNYTNLRIIAVW